MTQPSISPIVMLDAGADVPQKYPRALGRQPLQTINQVREEMARVYRACCAGKVAVKAGNALIYQLGVIARTLETEKIEAQLDMLADEPRALNRLGELRWPIDWEVV